MEWGKKFRNLTLTHQAPDETSPRTYYAQPSKPYEMRQRNAKTMGMLDGFKALIGPDASAKLRPDLSNGRIFFESLLIAERLPGDEAPTPRMTAVQQVLPEATKESILEAMQKAIADREKTRRGP